MHRIAMLGFLAAACGDNLSASDAGALPDAPDAEVGVADLTLIAAQMDNSILITNDIFTAQSCEVVEQCVDDVGARTLLRFDTVTANIGTADVIIGEPPADGVDAPPFSWSPCHGHHHLSGYAIYELLDDSGTVISGHKQAFCLQDSQQNRPGAPSRGYHCGMQGLSSGWADIYGRALPCQWIDVTDVPSGTYTLQVRVNPTAMLPEIDATNNVYQRSVTL